MRSILITLIMMGVCGFVLGVTHPVLPYEGGTQSQIIAALGSWYNEPIGNLRALVSDNGTLDINNVNMRDACYLFAKLYYVTGTYTYADKSAQLLAEFGSHIPNWLCHQVNGTSTPQSGPGFYKGWDAVGLWGRRPWDPDFDPWIYLDLYTGSTGIEYGGLPLVKAYDLIYNSNAMQTNGDLASITSMLRSHGTIFLDEFGIDSFTNCDGYAIKGILKLAYVIEEPEWVHECVWWMKALYKTNFYADGWWHEGSCSYHEQTHYHMKDAAANLLQGYSDPLGFISTYDGTRYDNLDIMSQMQRQFDRVDSIYYDFMQPLPTDPYYDMAQVIGDTSVPQRYAHMKYNKMTEAKSVLFGCMGHAILGTGKTSNPNYINDLTQATLHYGGMHGHEHYDGLHLTLFAKGKEIMSETMYRPLDGDPNSTRDWHTKTAGHNTVVVNSYDQPWRLDSYTLKRVKEPADDVPGIPDWRYRWLGQGDNMNDGKLKMFATDFNNVQVIEVDAQRAYGKRIGGTLMPRYRRMIALVKIDDHNSYVVDIFRVKGGSTHDYMLHSCLDYPHNVQIFNSDGSTMTLNKYSVDPIHTYIRNTYYNNGYGGWSAVFTLDNGSAALKTFVPPMDSTGLNTYVIKGIAPAMRRIGDAPFLIVRRCNFTGTPVSTFVAVHHPYTPSGGPLVTNVQSVSLNTTDANAVGLRVTLSGGRTDTIINTISDSYAQIQTSDGTVTLQGHFAHVSQNGGTAEKWAYMAESKYLNVSGKILMAQGSYQGTITDTYRREAGDSLDAFVTDTVLPTDGSLNNKYLIVDEGGVSVQTFRISSIGRIGSQTIIYSPDEPGITISPGLVKQEYYPCWGISGAATFKICDSAYTNLIGVRNANTGLKYSMIQPAIDAAVSGNTIEVSDGVFYENIDFLGKNLILKSLDPNDSNKVENTIISGYTSAPTVTLDGGEDSNCIINGLTIVNGTGSGILCSNSSPIIKNCAIANNDGNGISLINSTSKIKNCLIAGNIKDGIEKQGSGGVEITNCTIAENILYGVHYPAGSVSGDKIINSIVWNNNQGLAQITSSPLVQYSNVQGGFSGLGNIIADPCFASLGQWARCWDKIINLGTINVGSGINLITTVGDGDTEALTIVAHECRRTVDKNSDYYMYFDINDKVVYQGSEKDWYIQIDYYDSNGGSIGLEYDSDDGNDVPSRYKSGGTVTIGNTNKWKSYTFHVTDAYFGNRQNGGADFRIAKYSGGWLYLDCVYVRNYNTVPFDDTWVSGNYHLKSTGGRWDAANGRWVSDSVTSLCIDAGNPGYSPGLEPSGPNNVRINMGNYGGSTRASKTPAGFRPLSDMTNDGRVDLKDVDAFCDYWLDSGSDLPADLNRNAVVNFADFAIIADQWYAEAIWY